MHDLAQLNGLEVTELVYESAHSLIFKTRKTTDAPPTLLKILKTDSPSKKEIVRFHQEYSIAHRIDSPFVLPLVTLETLAIAYPDLSQALQSPNTRLRFGLTGDGPWPVVLPGYVLNSLTRSAPEIRQEAVVPISGDEFFPEP